AAGIDVSIVNDELRVADGGGEGIPDGIGGGAAGSLIHDDGQGGSRSTADGGDQPLCFFARLVFNALDFGGVERAIRSGDAVDHDDGVHGQRCSVLELRIAIGGKHEHGAGLTDGEGERCSVHGGDGAGSVFEFAVIVVLPVHLGNGR